MNVKRGLVLGVGGSVANAAEEFSVTLHIYDPLEGVHEDLRCVVCVFLISKRV